MGLGSWLHKHLGIGAPEVPAGTFTSTDPVTQQAINQGLGQVNQNIALGNQRSLEGMAAVGGLGTLGAMGAGGAAGASGGAGDIASATGMGVADGGAAMAGGGGALGTGLSWTDLLKGAGGLASGIANYAGQEAARKQQQQEFNQEYGLQAGQQADQIARQQMRLPTLDRAQYLANNVAAPTAFQPRDYTQGLGQLSGQATGGAAAQLAANQAAANNYRPGMGGTNQASSTMQQIMQRLGYTG